MHLGVKWPLCKTGLHTGGAVSNAGGHVACVPCLGPFSPFRSWFVMAGMILCVYKHFIWMKHQTGKNNSCRELVVPFWLPVLLIRDHSAETCSDGALPRFRSAHSGWSFAPRYQCKSFFILNFRLESVKALCRNVFCLDRLSRLLLQVGVLGRGWRGLSSPGRNGHGSCSGFHVPGNCVIVGCPLYRRLLLIGLLCLSLSALSENDAVPDQEQERWQFWSWAGGAALGTGLARHCSLAH